MRSWLILGMLVTCTHCGGDDGDASPGSPTGGQAGTGGAPEAGIDDDASSGGHSGSAGLEAGIGGSTGGSAGFAGLGQAGAAGSGGTGGDPACMLSAVSLPSGVWPDSKTAKCTSAACAESGRDDNFVWPVPNLTEANNVIKDHLTQLEWMLSFQGLLSNADAAQACTQQSVDGGGWRLPSLRELITLLDLGRDPAFPDIYSITPANKRLWTSTPRVGEPDAFWVIDFAEASIAGTELDSASVCVRGPALAQGPLVNISCGVVADQSTGLMWLESPTSTTFNWDEALAHCQQLDHAGHTDWRAPNLKELASLLKVDQSAPAIDPLLSQTADEWSSTSAGLNYHAHIVSFMGTGQSSVAQFAQNRRVRCVRGG